MNTNTQFAEFSSNSVSDRIRHMPKKAALRHIRGRSQHDAWGAFQAGMQVLRSYAGRSPANPEAIAKANLQLLHRSLLRDPSYTQSIKTASGNYSSNHLPKSLCIFNNKTLRADLLTLQSGTTIQLKPHQDSCAMYLSITGKPSIESADTVHVPNKHWWDRYRHQNHEQSLKNEDSIIVSSMKTKKRLLTAKKKECVLLRIQLPNI